MNIKSFFLFLSITSSICCHVLSPEKQAQIPIPVDITFMIADLKYNKNDGVKICEVQNANVSRIGGYDFLNGTTGFVPSNFAALINSYIPESYFLNKDICDKRFSPVFESFGWKMIDKKYKVMQILSDNLNTKAPIHNPYSLQDYSVALYIKQRNMENYADFSFHHPSVLVLDLATFYLEKSKKRWSELFVGETLQEIRPKCSVYPRTYSKNLHETIIDDLKSQWFVIKPLRGTKGRGVVICDRAELSYVLKVVTGKVQDKSDPHLEFWAKRKEPYFMVEQYFPSETVYVPHLGNQPYDGTMRVSFALIYNEGELSVEFLGLYWKLPTKSLNDQGSHTDLHKSFGEEPNFANVSPEIQEAVKEELNIALPYLHENMLLREELQKLVQK